MNILRFVNRLKPHLIPEPLTPLRAAFEQSLKALPGRTSRWAVSQAIADYEVRDRVLADDALERLDDAVVRNAVMDRSAPGWPFRVSSTRYRAELYLALVHGKSPGSEVRLESAVSFMRDNFGRDPVLGELFDVQVACQRSFRQWLGEAALLYCPFFTESENAMIPDHRLPALLFLEALAERGILEWTHPKRVARIGRKPFY